MKKLYLVRHGECVANVEGVVAGGANDSPLTEKGKEQAKDTVKLLAGLDFQAIIASTLSRAKDTADIIADGFNWSEGVETDMRIRELNVGDATGIPLDEYFKLEAGGKPIPNAETLEEMYARTADFISDIRQRPEKEFLIVSHNGAGRMIRNVASGGDVASFHTVPNQHNGEIIEVVLD